MKYSQLVFHKEFALLSLITNEVSIFILRTIFRIIVLFKSEVFMTFNGVLCSKFCVIESY